MWDKKFNNLQDLLRYLEQTEIYNYFKEIEGRKNTKIIAFPPSFIKYPEVIPMNKMVPIGKETRIACENNKMELSNIYKKQEIIKSKINDFTSDNDLYIKYLLQNELNKISFRLEYVSKLKDIFEACDTCFIYNVISLVDSWYGDFYSKNKFLYYGATLYYALRRYDFFNKYFICTKSSEYKKELEDTFYKCIINIDLNVYKDFL